MIVLNEIILEPNSDSYETDCTKCIEPIEVFFHLISIWLSVVHYFMYLYILWIGQMFRGYTYLCTQTRQKVDTGSNLLALSVFTPCNFMFEANQRSVVGVSSFHYHKKEKISLTRKENYQKSRCSANKTVSIHLRELNIKTKKTSLKRE